MCHTAIPNPMCGQRGGNMRGLEGEGTAGDLGFSHVMLSLMEENLSILSEASIYVLISIFARHIGWSFYFFPFALKLIE